MNQQPTFHADAVSAAYERGRAQTLNTTRREALSSINEKLGNIVMWIEHVTELPDVDLWIAEAKADYAADTSMGEDEAGARIQKLREAAQESVDNTLSRGLRKNRPKIHANAVPRSRFRRRR